MELLEKKKRKVELQARKKATAEVSRSPSPVKQKRSNIEDVKPKNLTRDLTHSNDTDQKGSTSYFIKMLDESQDHDQNEKDEARKLLSSRIYTFDEDLVCEPFAVNEKEYFSALNVSKRYLTHEALSSILEEKKILRLPKLYAKVAPPTFDEPRYANWVVIGIISKKSSPRATSDNRSKFMTIALTDFQLTVDILIFGKNVEKYVKLRVGDIVAILNPEIYIWKPDSQGVIRSFSLSIKHSYDCVLEIGKARDFGLCQSMKRDGTICGTPINTSKEDCCFYHKELRIRKTQGKRVELNGSFSLRSPTKNGRKQQFLMGGKDNKGNYSNSSIVEDRYAPKVDRISKSLVYFSNPHAGKAFFNDSYQNPDILKNIEEKKRKIQERKKESALRAKLLRLGDKPIEKKAPISKEEQIALQKKKALLKTAFQKDTLKNIGYDPTSKPNAKGVLDSDEVGDANETVLNEFSSLTQNKNINLGLSKEELAKRKEQRVQADSLMKRLKDREEKMKRESLQETFTKKRKGKDVNLDSESDSDFEVEGGDTKDAYIKFKLSQSKSQRL